jgi:hypothetical protein
LKMSLRLNGRNGMIPGAHGPRTGGCGAPYCGDGA